MDNCGRGGVGPRGSRHDGMGAGCPAPGSERGHGPARRSRALWLTGTRPSTPGGVRTVANPVDARSKLTLPGIELDLLAMTRAAVLARPEWIPACRRQPSWVRGHWDEVPPVGRLQSGLVGAPHRATAGRFLRHPGLQTVHRGGMVIANPASTVVDLVRFLERDEAAAGRRAALQQRAVTIAQLQAARARLGRLHRRSAQLDEVTALLVEGTPLRSPSTGSSPCSGRRASRDGGRIVSSASVGGGTSSTWRSPVHGLPSKSTAGSPVTGWPSSGTGDDRTDLVAAGSTILR